MAEKSMTDCYWFLQNQCTKGATCEYRHSEAALKNSTICKFWTEGKCTNKNCIFRHPSGYVQKDRSSTPCYFFVTSTCAKGDACPFSHSIPVNKTTAVQQQEEEIKRLQQERKLEEERLAELRARGEAWKRENEEENKIKKQVEAANKLKARPVLQIGKTLEGKRDKGAADQRKMTQVKQIVQSNVQKNISKTTPTPPPTTTQTATTPKVVVKKTVTAVRKVNPSTGKLSNKPATTTGTGTQSLRPTKPSEPVNFGVKTLEQIMKEKQLKEEQERKEKMVKEEDKVSQPLASADKTKSQSINIKELRKKNEIKFSEGTQMKKRRISEPEPTKPPPASKSSPDPSIDQELLDLGIDIEVEEEINVDDDLDKQVDELESILAE